MRDTNQILQRYAQFDVVQIKDQLEDPGVERLELGETSPSLVTHSVLGRNGHLRAYLSDQFRRNRELNARLTSELGLEPDASLKVVDLLLRCAMGRNFNGVVLCGMNRPRHISELSRLAALPVLNPASLGRIWEMLQNLIAGD